MWPAQVARLMRKAGLKGCIRDPAVADNLLEQDFTASERALGRYHLHLWLYPVVMDLYSRRIIRLRWKPPGNRCTEQRLASVCLKERRGSQYTSDDRDPRYRLQHDARGNCDNAREFLWD